VTAAGSSTPLVSIIVPVFNAKRYLWESLDSILAQTYPRIEVLVMDDASTDGTAEVIASFGDRVKPYRQPSNRGIYGNTNDGIALASGDYIATYHADDVYFPVIVEREVAFLERHREAGAVFCQDIFIDSVGHEVGRLTLPREIRVDGPLLSYTVVFNALLTHKNSFLRCPSSMVRTAVYEDVGPYRDCEYRNNADLEMWLRIARKYPIGVLEEYLFRYRYGHGNSAQRHRHMRTEPERYFLMMDRYLGEGDRAIATADALAAYEAHRAEDGLMRAVNLYILGRGDEGLDALRRVRARCLVRSSRVQRTRLLALFVILRGLMRLPRIGVVASLFYRRWHGRSGEALRGSAR
jgi:cellulose synthase/poly-beta-1,6-N-acetylglucosamine synthase-like glycosyltransferase